MKIRTVKHIIKEGIVNSYRNKLMSLASVFIVVATLMVFGFFLLVASNLKLIVETVKQQPQMEAFCYTTLDETQLRMVEDSIKNNDMIAQYEKVTKKQAYEKMKERLDKDDWALEGIDESIFPVSFIIKLKDTAHSGEVVEALSTTVGIEKVKFSLDAMNLITKFSNWITFVCTFMTIVLLVVSMFIIANTIKLTVFARRKEINIMKYIGATDWFIRWPFVVEGVIIGIVGAILAFILSSYGYNALEAKFAHDLLSLDTGLLKLIKINDIWVQLTTAYLAVGVVVGAAGSTVSLRKHLQV